eukprot:GHVN01015231.1.p1 GENE.GHVN01015231.1~~GHVN01015231.1.p1  ORF type:complete len:376 (-),score=61.89 GHVN01015231.1:1406-2533(-)
MRGLGGARLSTSGPFFFVHSIGKTSKYSFFKAFSTAIIPTPRKDTLPKPFPETDARKQSNPKPDLQKIGPLTFIAPFLTVLVVTSIPVGAWLWWFTNATKRKLMDEERFEPILDAIRDYKQMKVAMGDDKPEDRENLPPGVPGGVPEARVDQVSARLDLVDNILQLATMAVKESVGCWCVAPGSIGPRGKCRAEIVEVDPHPPESRSLHIPDKRAIPGMENNSLTDAFVGAPSGGAVPFNLVHFALNRESPLAKAAKLTPVDNAKTPSGYPPRRISLLYNSPSSGGYLTLSGTASVVEDAQLRRHYWKSKWGSTIEDDHSENYILVKLTVDDITLNANAPEKLSWTPLALQRDITDTQNRWRLDFEEPSTLVSPR